MLEKYKKREGEIFPFIFSALSPFFPITLHIVRRRRNIFRRYKRSSFVLFVINKVENTRIIKEKKGKIEGNEMGL